MSDQKDILFSVIVPTYNRADFIGKTLASLLNQEYRNFEIIVVDDGSTDNTEEVVKGLSDTRISYHRKPNGERGAARNFGARMAKGDYINFFDSDDLAYPNHLRTAAAFIKRNNAPAIFHLGYDFRSPDGTLLRKVNNLSGDISQKLIKTNFLSCNGVFLRKDIAAAFPFEEDRRMAVAEDWALWLIIGSRYSILYDNEITTSVIAHDQRSIADYNLERIEVRDRMLMELLLKDEAFTGKYQKQLPEFIADRYTFFALIASLKKDRKKTMEFLKTSFREDPSVLFRRRFLASFKHYLLSLIR